MILSALLTSVGINLGLCFLFFTLYSILRKQPGNVFVYAPRWVAEEKSQQRSSFNLERLLPSPGWVKMAWQLTEEELLSVSGLDAVVLMRIFIFSLKVFSVGGIIGVFILLPINYLGNQLSIDFSDLPNKSVDSFSISNVNDGSSRLWVHVCAVYVFTAFVCYLLYVEYDYVSAKRISSFHSSKPKPEQFTILVRSIPSSSGSSFSESVESFFTEYHSSTYLSHYAVRRTSRLQNLISDADKTNRKLIHLKSTNSTRERSNHGGVMGFFRHKSDLIDRYEKKLRNLRLEQSSLVRQELPAAFVSFSSRYGAALALNMQQGVNPIEWITEPAPEPHDVYWPFFSASFMKRWIYKFFVIVSCILLTVLFLIPVVLVQGLTHLEQLETWFPFLKDLLTMKYVSQIVTGYLPSLILQLFLSFVPPIMTTLSSVQGHIALSQIEKSSCFKLIWFTIWNVFFANVLSGSVLSQFNVFLEPKEIPRVLAEVVPTQASFFIAYAVTSGWTSTSSELVRVFPLICNYIKGITGKADEDCEVPPVPYHTEIPRIMLFGLIGVTYFFLSPLILPFILIYYCLGYIIYRNQLLNVYASKSDTGGTYWPIVHSSMIFSLMLMHTIAIGLFTLKKLPFASSVIVPLPALTFLFDDYCRKRFLPIFKAYSTESLIKRDRLDQDDPTMTEFLDYLATAYRDPAVMPIQYSGSSESRESLLHSAGLLS